MHDFDIVHMIISSLAGALIAAAFGLAAVWLAARMLRPRRG